MNSIEELKEDLWKRWQAWFDNPVLPKPAGVTRVACSRTALFNLKDWTPRKFPPGGRLLPKANDSENYVYELDTEGRPVGVSFLHTFLGIEWRGVYRYAPQDQEIEYIEICVQSKVPSRYDRVTTRDRQLATFQRLIINGGGNYPVWRSMPRDKVLEMITTNGLTRQIWIEEYEAQEGRLRTGRAYTEGLGLPPRYASLAFSYSITGKLQRVVRHEPEGVDQTVFAARTKSTMKDLSASLSRRLAERIIERLNAAAIDSPLVAIELSFRSADQYVPVVIPFTERDRISGFPVLEAYTHDRMSTLRTEEFEPEMTEFVQRMRESERYEMGRKMLREAARLVTEQQAGTVPTAEGFVAYAVDWELEADEFSTILKECGADSKVVALWKKRGWLG